MNSDWTLKQWLAWQEALHPSEMDLGLERIRQVAQALLPEPGTAKVIMVGGTNGKGSCVAAMQAVLSAHGFSHGSYTSPHLRRYNERVKFDGEPVSDQDLCLAFAAVEQCRGSLALTVFEFGTLAALWLFARRSPDYLLLEVGLGGRLDAVNIVDADVSVITSIALDHQAWLGSDRSSIAKEKVGIARPGRPLVSAESDWPEGYSEILSESGAGVLQIGEDFHVEPGEGVWHYAGVGRYSDIPMAAGLLPTNLAAGIAALEAVGAVLDPDCVRRALAGLRLDARCEVLAGQPEVILDVAHNPAAARRLAQFLGSLPRRTPIHALCGMLADKDMAGTLDPLKRLVDGWHMVSLPGPRGATGEQLIKALGEGECAWQHETIESAIGAAREAAGPEGRLLVMGSFLTVEAYLRNG